MALRTRRTALLAGPSLVLAPAVLVGVLAVAPAQAEGSGWPGHPDRRLVVHVVRAGDTATALAVRYHAWTRELVALNHLGRRAALRVGQRLRIPVVVSAAARDRARPHARPPVRAPQPHPAARPQAMTRTQVGAALAREARRRGVPVRLVKAVAWQESGWQQGVVSPAGAVGVMQVLPATGLWMSLYTGRPLDLRDTHDNIIAGVTLLRVLLDETGRTRRAVGAYYQGLGAVQRHGLYRDTKRYVASVLALRDRMTG